jgi:hypothetical protein
MTYLTTTAIFEQVVQSLRCLVIPKVFSLVKTYLGVLPPKRFLWVGCLIPIQHPESHL